MSQTFQPPQTELFRTLWAAQEGCCALCGLAMPESRFDLAHATLWKKQRPTFDHIRPKAAGGSDAPGNLQLAHAICNLRKGAAV